MADAKSEEETKEGSHPNETNFRDVSELTRRASLTSRGSQGAFSLVARRGPGSGEGRGSPVQVADVLSGTPIVEDEDEEESKGGWSGGLRGGGRRQAQTRTDLGREGKEEKKDEGLDPDGGSDESPSPSPDAEGLHEVKDVDVELADLHTSHSPQSVRKSSSFASRIDRSSSSYQDMFSGRSGSAWCCCRVSRRCCCYCGDAPQEVWDDIARQLIREDLDTMSSTGSLPMERRKKLKRGQTSFLSFGKLGEKRCCNQERKRTLCCIPVGSPFQACVERIVRKEQPLVTFVFKTKTWQ